MTGYHAELTINSNDLPFLVAEGIPMRKYAGGRFGQKVVNGYQIAIYVNPVSKE